MSNLSNIIQNNTIKWIHVERMEPEGIPKQLMGYTHRGTRSIGRPKLRWKVEPALYRNGSECPNL
jgi:hypothetical protein